MYRGYVLIFTTWTLLGLSSSELRVPNRSARSAPTTISRRNEAPHSTREFEENLDVLIEKLQSLKSAKLREQEEMSAKTGLHSNLHPSQSKTISRTSASNHTAANKDINTFFNVFTSLYSMYEPVLVESLLQNLPQAFICVLADKTECGWQADLTAMLSSSLSGPVLSFLSSLKAQICPFTSIGSTRMANSTFAQLKSFQELVTAALSSQLPLYLSDNFMFAWNSFIDLTLLPVVSFISEVMVNFLQTFMDFLTIGLQIGVDVPSLDQTQQCQQGDLKQLVMWGMDHNVNWSFGDSILNMFLALDVSSCDYTDTACQIVQLGRSSTSPVSSTTRQLTCDQQDVSRINATLCADILANTYLVPDVLYGVCKALNTLSHSELIQMWRNTCQMVQLVLSPLLEPCPLPQSQSSQRVARSTLSLSKLFCNYENWTTVQPIDPSLVTICSENDPAGFLQGVCNNILVMQTLILNPSNAWVWEYCANASDQYVILQYCIYETWTPQTLDPSVVAFCWNNDQMRMETLLCQDLNFYLIVFSNVENSWIQPNCSEIPMTTPVDQLTLIAESCNYSEWQNIKKITIDQVSLCIQNDEVQFVSEVCSNSTFLAALVLNDGCSWVGQYCTFSINNPPTGPPLVSPPAFMTSSISTTASITTRPTVNSSNSSSTLSASNTPRASITPTLSSSLFPSVLSISSITPFPTTHLFVSSTGSIAVVSSTNVLTAFPVASSVTPSPTTTLTVSSTGSIVSVSPTKVLIVSSMLSTITPSPTTLLSVSSTSSITNASPTKVLTVSSMLSSISPSPTTPLSVSSTDSINSVSPSNVLTMSSVASSITPSSATPLSVSSTGSINSVSSTKVLTVSSVVSSSSPSTTTPLSVLSTGSIISVSPTNVLTVSSVASSITPSSTTPLSVSSTGSINSISSTKVLTVFSMASSITPSSSTPLSVSSMGSITNVSPTKVPTVSSVVSSITPPTTPLSVSSTGSITNVSPTNIFTHSLMTSSITPSATPLSVSSTGSITNVSPTNVLTVSSMASSIPPSSATPLSVSSTGSITNVSPTNVLTHSSMASSITPSATPLSVSSTGSINNIPPTNVLTVSSMASSIPPSATPLSVSSTDSITNVSPTNVLTVSSMASGIPPSSATPLSVSSTGSITNVSPTNVLTVSSMASSIPPSSATPLSVSSTGSITNVSPTNVLTHSSMASSITPSSTTPLSVSSTGSINNIPPTNVLTVTSMASGIPPSSATPLSVSSTGSITNVSPTNILTHSSMASSITPSATPLSVSSTGSITNVSPTNVLTVSSMASGIPPSSATPLSVSSTGSITNVSPTNVLTHSSMASSITPSATPLSVSSTGSINNIPPTNVLTVTSMASGIPPSSATPLSVSSTGSITNVSPTNILTHSSMASSITPSSTTPPSVSSTSSITNVSPTNVLTVSSMASGIPPSSATPLSVSSTGSITNVSPTNILAHSSMASSITPSSTTPPSVSSTGSITNVSPTNVLTIFPMTSSMNLSPSTPLSVSLTYSIISVSPTVFLTVFPMASIITPSPTTPLSVSSTGSVVSVSPTNVQTASSISLFPSALPAVSSTNSNFSISNSLSPSIPPSFNITQSFFFFTSSMSISSTISTSLSNITLALTNPSIVIPSVSRTAFTSISSAVSSITLSPTASPTVPPAVPSITNMCNYASWEAQPSVDPLVVGLCWQLDMAAFNLNVCCSISLFRHLLLDPKNQWLNSVCSNNDTTTLVNQICLYSDWSQPTIVDMTVLALCADLDTVNFTNKVCNNGTILQNLLANLDNTWLLEQCSNLTGLGGGKGSLMGFVPSVECQYTSWAVTFPDALLVALCWDYDQAKFISSICINPNLLSFIVTEPANLWVKTMCTTYSNYSRNITQYNNSSNYNNTNSGSYNNTNNGRYNNTNTQPCLVKALIDGLNWSCSVDVNAACQAGISQFQGLQLFFRCGVEVLLPRLQKTVNPQVASIVSKTTNVWVVLLLILEENGLTTLSVTNNIRQSVLDSVSAFLERETVFDNKRVLLQCFGKVLTSLMQTERDVTTNGIFLIKEYFNIPLASLRAVLSSVDVNTMRLILQYLSRNQANLQLSEEYLRIMMNVLVQVQLRKDQTLFLDLSPLLSVAATEDIMSLPPLQTNVNVLNFINSIINNLTLDQQQAFGWWFGQSVGKDNMTTGGLSFIRDSGNLIAYLPFYSFQDLSPAQLLDGLDVLLSKDLGQLKLQFVAQSIIGGYKNLTADQFRSFGNLTCQAHLNDFSVYMGTDVFQVIQENIRTCVSNGITVPSAMITSLFLNSSDVQSPASLSPQKISQLAQFLPLMGSDFLQQLSQTQLQPIISVLATVPFTPIQAAIIIDKVSSSLNLSEPDSGAVSKLRFLASGLSKDTLWNLSSDALMLALTNFSQYTSKLTPPQANIISTKLWCAPSVVTQWNEVEPLLSSMPLLCVIARAHLLLTNGSAPYTHTWNTQQAKTLFNEAMTTIQNLTTTQFTSLGTVAQGVSCTMLTSLIQNNPTVSAISGIMRVLRKQPVLLHSSLVFI